MSTVYDEKTEEGERYAGVTFSLSLWRHWQSVKRRACLTRLSQPSDRRVEEAREGGREGEGTREKATAAVVVVGSLGMQSSERASEGGVLG